MNSDIKVIGISGYAKAGKDTFVAIAKNILSKNGYTGIRVAFADTLKEEIQQMLIDNKFSLNIHDITPEEKEQVRPLFVFWGCQRRRETPDGLYWVRKAEEKIKFYYAGSPHANIEREKLVFLVSDVRFPNEVKWVHETFGGEVIHLRKYTVGRSKALDANRVFDDQFIKDYDEPPNEEERKQDPIVREMSDFFVDWEKSSAPNLMTDPIMNKIVLEALNRTKYFRHPTIGILS